MLLHFTKMEGCGNDYIYINGFTEQVPQEKKAELVRKLSRYHFGIGGDGVIFINPSDRADFEMEMYNRDGSRGKMCGNGIRCVGKYVYDHGMTEDRTNITVESFGEVKKLELFCRDGKMLTARVNMGKPVLEASRIPVLPEQALWEKALSEENDFHEGALPEGAGSAKTENGEKAVIDAPIKVDGRIWYMTCVSMGNPHDVVFVEESDLKARGLTDDEGREIPDGDIRNLDLPAIGPLFEHHRCFPERTNTEFVQVIDRGHVNMRVWERGSGETLACGTGCCATAVACVLNGKTDRTVEVNLLGGVLQIEWDEKTDEIYMTGPAQTVFDGTVEISL